LQATVHYFETETLRQRIIRGRWDEFHGCGNPFTRIVEHKYFTSEGGNQRKPLSPKNISRNDYPVNDEKIVFNLYRFLFNHQLHF